MTLVPPNNMLIGLTLLSMSVVSVLTLLREDMLMTQLRMALFVVRSLLMALMSVRLPMLYRIMVVVFLRIVSAVKSPFSFTVVLAIRIAPFLISPTVFLVLD